MEYSKRPRMLLPAPSRMRCILPTGGDDTCFCRILSSLLTLNSNRGIYGANFQPQDIPAGEITHVLYAFADIASDGTV